MVNVEEVGALGPLRVVPLDAAELTAVVAEQPALTVFAPTDEAFDNLEAANPGILAALLAPENIDLLQAILLNHVLAGATTRQQAEEQARLYSLRPSVLDIAGDGGGRGTRTFKSLNSRIHLTVKCCIARDDAVFFLLLLLFIPVLPKVRVHHCRADHCRAGSGVKKS